VRNTVTEIMNASDRTIRPDKAKERIDETEDRSIDITQPKTEKNRTFKKSKTIREHSRVVGCIK
jgi:mannose-6-phosphate isomerase class I